jgi:hypothetical protein
MVLASIPVASPILLAALPVGAAHNTRRPEAWKAWMMPSVVVVLPVPGPPVRTMNLLIAAVLMASSWISS